MASSSRTRGKRSPGFFADLDSLSTADFCIQRQTKRKKQTLDGGRLFDVQRIISSRDGREGKEYLVKWREYSPFECTWEPREHLNQQCLKYFEDPKPDKDLVLTEVARLRVAVAHSLKASRTRKATTVEFRADVFKFLFKGKGKKDGRWQLLLQDAFKTFYFPTNWHYMLDLHGQGTKIHFPVKVRHFISLSPKNFHVNSAGTVSEGPRVFQEKITMDFIKVAA